MTEQTTKDPRLLREQALRDYRDYIEAYQGRGGCKRVLAGKLAHDAEAGLAASIFAISGHRASRAEIMVALFHLIDLAEASYPVEKYARPPRPHGL